MHRPPHGFSRPEVGDRSFAAWLRGLPVRLDRRTVHSHRGLPLPSWSAAVVALDLGEGDLQQCADSILRLHAEYLWAADRETEAEYHFTSGDPSSWSSWVRGERFRVHGSRVERVSGAPRSDDHRSFRRWLQHLFRYAGTLSLASDSRTVDPTEELEPGDFFVLPGSPGHAVMILDVAADADGTQVALIGQGFTPAQDFHVLRSGDATALNGVWFPLPHNPNDSLEVPTWAPFPRTSARRFTIPP
jgi:hypothetical protein